MRLKLKNELNMLTAQGAILTGYCLICNSPMFFSWEDRKGIECPKCGTLHRLLPGNRSLNLAIVTDIIGNSGVVKCAKCGTIFEPEETRTAFTCPNCKVLYYNQRAGLMRNIHKRLNLKEDETVVIKKIGS